MVKYNAGKRTVITAGNCLSEIAKMPMADLVFLDPPFNLGKKYDSSSDRLPDKKYKDFLSNVFELCIARMKPTATLWLNMHKEKVSWCDNRLRELGLYWRDHIVWHYRFGQHTDSKFIGTKSHVLYMTKHRKDYTWNPHLILEPSDRKSKYGDKRTDRKTKNPGYRVPHDVWYGEGFCRIQGNNKERVSLHNNQLPEAVLFRVLRGTANARDTILDPFFGSGTTGVVADYLDMKTYGIEISDGYAASAAARVDRGPVDPPPILP